jgi:ribosomal protein S18 acetylase RimI-like enzyme
MLTIRDCTGDDLDLLERRMPTGGTDAHRHHFRRQQAGIRTDLIAWADEEPVGGCLICWDGCVAAETRAAMPGAVEICNVHVHPGARGGGVGTALLYQAEQRIAARGIIRCVVSVATDNPRAAALYTRLGYTDTGVSSIARYPYGGVEVVEYNLALGKDLRQRRS